MNNKAKITVVGSGYVGMSLSVLLSQKNDVIVLDIDSDRVNKINNKESTVADKEIEYFLANKKLSISATLNIDHAYKDADFVIVATPTNYDVDTNKFDTHSVDKVIRDALLRNKNALIIIKSTIPVGHTQLLQKKYESDRIIFSPEFLREGSALEDNLYPSRIIIGASEEKGNKFANLLTSAAQKDEIELLFMESTEAEAVKLFANTYLAMRVSFFNELDSYALNFNLDTKSIIEGICLDDRIGTGYNNPSLGYGGYCLPKDTKQLLANFKDVPQDLIDAIVSSNSTRKDFLKSRILLNKPKVVGFFRLVMKEGSDNFRFSAIQGIIKRVQDEGVEVIIFEPEYKNNSFMGAEMVNDIDAFKARSDIIVANRMNKTLEDVKHKCFSRDVYQEN